MVNEFIKKELANHYYTFAIHDKPAAFGNGKVRNMHCHLMFSERLIDDAELEAERPAKIFFMYPKRNAVTLADKRKGGAPKERRFALRSFLPEIRKSFAEVTDSILEKYGKPDRVDHRSLEAMRREAIANGDEYLAKILDRLPESHIGLANALDENNPSVKRLKKYRRIKSEYKDKLFEKEILERTYDDNTIMLRIEKLMSQAEKIRRMPEYAAIEGHDADDLLFVMREEFHAAIKELQAWRDSALWTDDAINQAEYEFIDDEDDKENWQQYRSLNKSLRNYEELRDSLSEEEKAANPELATAIFEKIHKLDQEINVALPFYEAIEQKLLNDVTRDRIETYIHKKFGEDKYSRKELKRAATYLENIMREFEYALFEDEREIAKRDAITLKELYAILRNRYYGYKKEYEKIKKTRDELRREVIVPSRARKMAESNFENSLDREHEKLRAQLETARQQLLDFEKSKKLKTKKNIAALSSLRQKFKEMLIKSPIPKQEV